MNRHSKVWRNDIETKSADPNELLQPYIPNDYISRVKNRIYFYSDIEDQKVLQLNRELFQCATNIISESVITQNNVSNIFLHINSYGGSFFSGLSTMDEVLRIKDQVPITTVVDGVAASAATFITIAGTHRLIKRHSFMLIHQISSGFWGTYEEFKDEKENMDKFMSLLKDIYKTYTKLPMKKLNEVLKRDLFLTSAEALEYGLVDEVI